MKKTLDKKCEIGYIVGKKKQREVKMKKVLFALVLALGGCDGVYVQHGHGYSTKSYHTSDHYHCDPSEPYYTPAEEYNVYYDHWGNYEGECGIWYLGWGEWEEWCLWQHSCSWEFVDYWYY